MAKKKDKGAEEKAAEEQPKRGAHAKHANEASAPAKKEDAKQSAPVPKPESKQKAAQVEKSPEAKKPAKSEKAGATEATPANATAAQPTRDFVMPKGRIGAGRSVKKSVKKAQREAQAQGVSPQPMVAPPDTSASAPTEQLPPSQSQKTQALPAAHAPASHAAPAPVASAGYVPAYQSPDAVPKKAHKGLKIFGIVMGSLVGLVAVAYLVGVFIFMGRFFPNTTIIGLDISGKTPDEVHEMFDDIMSDYSFEVVGPAFDVTLRAKEMGMSLDSQSIADGLLSEMNPWAWPYEIFQRHDDTEDLISTLENTRLADTLTREVEEANKKGVPPQNAFVSYDGATDRYTIVPEVEGNTLLADVVIQEVTRGTVNFAPKVELSEAVVAKPTVTQDDPSLAATRDEANKYLDGALSLTMAGVEKMVVTRDDIASQITLGDDLSVTYDPEPLVEAVKEQVNVMDTTGAERTFTRPDGKQITVKGGDYGWITDSQATADAVRNALLAGTGGAMEIAMKQNAAMAPDENGRDFGGRYIDVDLSEQHARLYAEDGSIVWESDIVSGKPADGRNTPQGTYYIKTNDGKSVLRGYKPDGTKDYETNVDYWMPFKDNSVGFHDASWQPTFGGDWFVNNGSHGCVNLPVDKARELHEIIEVGDVVVVHE